MNDPRRDAFPNDAAPPQDAAPPERGGGLRTLVVGAIGVLSALYLLNPTLGIFELIPDNLPVVGNLDEATATTLLLSSLAYFGWDMRTLLGRRRDRSSDFSSERGKHGQ